MSSSCCCFPQLLWQSSSPQRRPLLENAASVPTKRVASSYCGQDANNADKAHAEQQGGGGRAAGDIGLELDERNLFPWHAACPGLLDEGVEEKNKLEVDEAEEETELEDSSCGTGSSSSCSSSRRTSTSARSRLCSDRPILQGLRPDIRERLTSAWTAEELCKVRSFADSIEEQCLKSDMEAERDLVSAFGCADRCAWRFLRSTGWNLEQAWQRFQETAAWRRDVLSQRIGLDGGPAFSAKGDTGLPGPPTAASLKVFASEDGRALFPCIGWDGGLYNRGDDGSSRVESQWWRASEGSPVELWRMEKLQIHRLFGMLSDDDIVDLYLEFNERRRQQVNEVGAAGYLVLVDASGLGFSHLRDLMSCARKAVSVIGSVGERHYPGSIRRAIVFNAPAFIHAIYHIVQPVLSTATRESIAIHKCGADDVQELRDLLPEGAMEEMMKQLA